MQAYDSERGSKFSIVAFGERITINHKGYERGIGGHIARNIPRSDATECMQTHLLVPRASLRELLHGKPNLYKDTMFCINKTCFFI